MKKVTIIIIIVAMGSLFASAQQPISNKGNRLQTYPSVTAVNPDVEALVNEVSMQNLENSIRWMQELIRDACSPAALETQNWLIEQFENYGLDVYVHYFPAIYNTGLCTIGDTLDAGNVVAIQWGTEFPDEYIVVSSHYDHPDGPGADDNASGTSGVLEVARILSQHSFKRSIMYVPFNAEEQWMVGSLPFVEKCAREDLNILGVFNLDMIGYFPTNQGDIRMGTGYSCISKNLFDYYFQVANLYLPSVPTFQVSAGDSYGGDHMPFNMYEYPALYIGDTEYLTPCYHRPCDTIGTGIDNSGVNNFNLVQAFTQATIAATTELANAWLPPQNLSAVPDISKVMISWDEAPQTSVYKLFKNNALLVETAVPLYEDSDVMEGEEYTYYVTGIHSETEEESAYSNIDGIIFTTALELPYKNDFQTNTDGFIVENSSWTLRPEGSEGNVVFSNASPDNERFIENYLSMVEMNWFPIPDDTGNITLRFKYSNNINGIWGGRNVACFLEVTTDRKYWHKLKKFSGTSAWKNQEVSLNEFIGAPFFQIRFRMESSGAWDRSYMKVFKMDDVNIDFSGVSGIQSPEQHYFKNLVISPNPTTGRFNIETGLTTAYHLAIYNLQGIKVFEKESFKDGMLDVSNLPKGIYILKITTRDDGVAKKIVLQ